MNAVQRARWSTCYCYMYHLGIFLNIRSITVLLSCWLLGRDNIFPEKQVFLSKNTHMTLCTFIQATSLKMTRHQKRKIDETHVEVCNGLLTPWISLFLPVKLLCEDLFFETGSQGFSSLLICVSNKCEECFESTIKFIDCLVLELCLLSN